MKVLIPLLISSIAGLSTVIGSLLVFIKIKKNKINSFITFCLSFSLGVMLCISITDLIPNSYFIIVNKFNIIKGTIISIFFFLLGYILTNKVDLYIKKRTNETALYKIGILSMIALMLHNFPEGIATFMASYEDLSIGIPLAIAIMMHNIPEGISIAIPIYYATSSKKKAIYNTFISGITEPIGALIAYLFLSKYISMVTISFVLLFVAGIMVTLSINDLLKESLSYNIKKPLIIGIISGVLVILLNHLV